MHFLKGILYTSVFAGLCAVAFSMATEQLLLLQFPPVGTPLHGFIFGNTLLIYNLHYGIKKIPEGVSDRADWTHRHPYVHPVLIVLSFLLSGICLFYLSVKVLLVSMLLGVLALGYSLPVLPFKNKKRLKDWGLLKIFLLCLVWACVTVIIPMIYWEKSFDHYQVEFLLRFVLMIPLCITFDIRDMTIDREHQIYTLPNAIGLRNAYRIIDISIVIFMLLVVWQYARYPIIHRLVSGFLIAAVTKVIIELSKKYNSDLFHLLCIDGVMLLYAVLILI